MKSKFNKKAEEIIKESIIVAERMGHNYVGSEHILMSLSKDEAAYPSISLLSYGITYERLFEEIRRLSGTNPKSNLDFEDFTPKCKKILENSYKIAVKSGNIFSGPEHIFLAIVSEGDSVAVKLLNHLGVDVPVLKNEAKKFTDVINKKQFSNELNKGKSYLKQYAKDLNELAYCGNFDKLIGREREIQKLSRVLSRKNKNNACLIGEAGVGKTAIVEGLAEKIASGAVSEHLKKKKIFSLDISSVVAGTKYRGDFEERIKNILNEASKDKDIILFIDEMHTIVGAGGAEGALDASNILKPMLARNELQVIGATTPSEYHKFIESDSALERRFHTVYIDEPGEEETENILIGLRENYERYHGISIEDEAITAAVKLSQRYINDRHLPDKAIDLIDEACAKVNISAIINDRKLLNIEDKIKQLSDDKENAVKNCDFALAVSLKELEAVYNEELERKKEELRATSRVTRADIEEIIAEQVGIPLSDISAKSNPASMAKRIKNVIFGQNEAIDSLIKAVTRSYAGISKENRPLGVFLFVGHSGVGKTELAKLLAKELFYSSESFIRLDMSEYSESNAVSKLIGAPPGYVGYEKGGTLTEKIRRHPYSVVLFDEIEKAHEDVIALLLQITDDGFLTDSDGRRVNFRNSYIILTSNAGFNSPHSKGDVGFMGAKYKELDLSEFFKPELLGRIDEIIYFDTLNKESFLKIAAKHLRELALRLEKNCGISLSYSNEIPEFIIEDNAIKKKGARAVNHTVVSKIENRVAEMIVNEEVKRGDTIRIELSELELIFEVFSSERTELALKIEK